MTVFIIPMALATAGLVVYLLLTRITAWGGDRTDGLDVANKFMTEADAFRGRSSSEAPPLDGKNRIAPPTQDGGF